MNLFISYAPNTHRQYAHALKAALSVFGISGFVAHDDIPPGTEWRSWLLNGLQNSDALLFIASPESAASDWCNQEVGYALGSQKMVVTVMSGASPTGFVSAQQGIRSHGNATEDAAEAYKLFIQNPLLARRIASGLAQQLHISGSYARSNSIADVIRSHPVFTERDIAEIERAQAENNQVSNATHMGGALYHAKSVMVP